jgi:hypothetical protein
VRSRNLENEEAKAHYRAVKIQTTLGCNAKKTNKQTGALTYSKNLMSEGIKSRIAGGNRCFYSLRQIFRSRAMSKAVKIDISKMMLKEAAVYRSEIMSCLRWISKDWVRGRGKY